MDERKLDTKTMVAFALMTIMMIWMFFTQEPPQPQPSENKANTEISENKNIEIETISDSISLKNYQNKFGAFGNLTQISSKENISTFENDKILVKINNKGGQISEVLIKNQKTYKGEPVYLIKNENSNFSLKFKTQDNRFLNTKDLFFEPSVSKNTISMKVKVSENQHLEFLYSLKENDYMIDFSVRSQGLSSVLNTSEKPEISWELVALRQEKSITYEDRYTQLIAQYEDDRLEKLSETSDDKGSEKDILWVAFKQHLFSSFLISENKFPQGELISKRIVKDELESEQQTKAFSFSSPIAYKNGELNEDFHFYFGPSDYSILKKYEKFELQRSIPLGWGIFGWINKGFVIPVFDFLTNHISVGIAIIVLTILIKLILSPIQYKSYVSQEKMKILRPEIEEINAKYKEPMKRQQETMALYSKAGVNPMSGCIPALLQMPVFFALFSFFPAAFALRQQKFLWAEDLASYDAIAKLPFNIPFYGDHISLFPLLASVAIFIYMLMTTGQMQQPQQEGMPNMKFMIYLSPIMMLFFFNNYASGLSLYYFISNLITIFIMLAIKYFILDAKKIHAQIEENKQKPKTESKFQRKMREMMEQAQAQQKNRK